LLNEVREAQAANEIGTSEEALELAQQLYQKYQHNPERVKES
jgi:hypothetical protein